MRNGVKVKVSAGKNYDTVKLINWQDPEDNDFYIAEEVTLKGNKNKRPDIVLYIKWYCHCRIRTKKGIVDIGEGVRKTLLICKIGLLNHFCN